MTKRQKREHKIGNQLRKLKTAHYAFWIGGLIQDGKYTKKK